MIRNPHAVVRLSRSMIQRVPRGVLPSRHITAPENLKPADLITERERLAYFERSRNFHASSGGTSPVPSPDDAPSGLAPINEDAP